MVQLESKSRLSFPRGMEQVRELLRQARRAIADTELFRLVDEAVELLCKLSSLPPDEGSPSLPELVVRLGKGLAKEGRLHLWARVLGRFSQEASSQRDLAAIAAAAQTVELAARADALAPIFECFRQPGPPRVDALCELLEVLPATALSQTTRFAVKCVPEILLEPVREYCRSSADHHIAGLAEAAADPDPAIARFALSVVEKAGGERTRRIAAASLRHPIEEVRVDAIKRLGEVGDEAATRLLLDRLERRRKSPLTEAEEKALYVALIWSGRHEALARVEDRLVGGIQSFSSRLKKTFARAPDDPVAVALIAQLSANKTAQARDLLQRGMRSQDPAISRACRDALQKK